MTQMWKQKRLKKKGKKGKRKEKKKGRKKKKEKRKKWFGRKGTNVWIGQMC